MKSAADNEHMEFSGNLHVELHRSAGLADTLVYQYWQNKLKVVTHLQVFQPCYFVNLFHFHVTDDISVLNNTGSSDLIKNCDGCYVRKYL
jgi:Gpi18-like mannosyltransferase